MVGVVFSMRLNFFEEVLLFEGLCQKFFAVIFANRSFFEGVLQGFAFLGDIFLFRLTIGLQTFFLFFCLGGMSYKP